MAAKFKQSKEQADGEAQAPPSHRLNCSDVIDARVIHCGDNLKQLTQCPASATSIRNNMMKHQLLLLTLACALLSGCGRNEQANNQISIANTNSHHSQSDVQYDAPQLSSEGRKVFEKMDRASLTNIPGFNVDFDGDGTIDFVSMSDSILYYSKGLGNDKFAKEIPIAKLKGSVVAYSIRTTPDQPRPYLVFFDDKDNGYMQSNLGTNTSGIPYLGNVEELGEKKQ